MNISIIIPTLNEEKTIGRALSYLRQSPSLEIIIADGGSNDQTVSIANKELVHVVTSPPGRGIQLNKGALAATHNILLFLHCDTVLPENFLSHIQDILYKKKAIAGAFRLSIDNREKKYRVIEWGANLRSEKLQLVYGDQAIFVKRDDFFKAGCFPEQRLLEDVTLIKNLKQHGRIITAPIAISTSSRRWEKLGTVKTTLINQIILIAYHLGISPDTLARFYYDSQGKTKL